MTRKRIVFLMSDTGGGHRAAADAIRTALNLQYLGEYTFELVDVFRRYTPFPFSYLPEIYPRWISYAGWSWKLVYRLADAPRRDRMFMALLESLWRDGIRRMVGEHPGDVFVCVHALFSRPVMHMFPQAGLRRPPFVTVITDLVTTHAFWYEKDVDRCLVPTQAAYERALKFGLNPGQLRLTGLPIHPGFVESLPEREEARKKLNQRPSLPVVLLVAGGSGMGPVYRIACELNRRKLEMQLVVVAGRNHGLRQRLESVRWNQPTLIYPFVNTMPELMSAADILVTKAGPATICEACIAGLPIVLSGAVPGQEDGNITYVVENGAGAYAPSARLVGETVSAWLAGGQDRLARLSENARKLGHPRAVWEIAEEIHAQAHASLIRTRFCPHKNGHQPSVEHTLEDGWVL
jgi:1,2-diacylglycerol 3-beta-galactosyltransferase